MSSSATLRKPLGVRATPEQHRLLTEAAAREHRSVSSFVLSAAIRAAESQDAPTPRLSEEQASTIIKESQAMFRKSAASHRDLLNELLEERRKDAKRA